MPIRVHQVAVALCLFLANFGQRHATAEQTTATLVAIEGGDLPIILSAPHGGRGAIPGAAERRGVGVDSFKVKSDFNTGKLTEQLADAIEKQLGKRPYLVIARFHRKYADANRRDRDAYESPEAQVAYDAYHLAIAEARRDVIDRWGRGILFDIHGQSAEPNAVFRGTQNSKTTTHLVNRFGREAQSGETSVFGQLARLGVSVIPAPGSTDREHVNYDGGYIVTTYGSSSGGTLDAIQMEVGRELRSTKAIPTTASKLAGSIAAFTKEYLPIAHRIAPVTNGEPATVKVRIGVYCDVGAGPSSKNLLNALQQFDIMSVKKVMAADIRDGVLADLDVLIHPGGSGGGQGRHLGEDGREMIRTFIADGGGYIGICAGAYLASADYEWSLNVLDAKVLDRKHWNRGTGTVDIAITDAGQKLLRTEDQRLAIHYAQGPLLAPGNRPDLDDYEVMATFETEIVKNGAPQGVMKGTTAIARGQYGRGRVVCFSPHPEMTSGLESLVHYAIDHVKRNRPLETNRQDNDHTSDATIE